MMLRRWALYLQRPDTTAHAQVPRLYWTRRGALRAARFEIMFDWPEFGTGVSGYGYVLEDRRVPA